ncbi:hypothetical protein [uncultured Pseudoteredinibacter sp.]|uniref:hypothetical protein n=1 Tax=uncultured Pseudoteredinibacter sp. TaxID=1641701 RepID=UPI00260FE70D|nr:hypothetical protein [uncultured Pseudoteredinibacter sp.]
MTRLINFLPILVLSSFTAIVGCSSSGDAEATAEAIVISGVSKSAENEQMLKMFKKQPEFKAMVSCFTQSLENQG